MGPKNAEKRLKIFSTPLEVNEVWFSRSTFHEKAKKNLQGVLFCQCRSKTQILAEINIF